MAALADFEALSAVASIAMMSDWLSGVIATDVPMPSAPIATRAGTRICGASNTLAAVTTTEDPSSAWWKTLKPWKVSSLAETGEIAMSAVATYCFCAVATITAAASSATTTIEITSTRCWRIARRKWTGPRRSSPIEDEKSLTWSFLTPLRFEVGPLPGENRE